MKQGHVLLALAAFSALAVICKAQDWKQIGPEPMQAHGLLPDTPNATVSGLVADIAIDPGGLTDSTIYIATAGGGIWRTTDGAANWSPLTDMMPVSQTMAAVALDPLNAGIVYAGAGGPYCCLQGGGLYGSLHGGNPNTWETLNPNGIFTGAKINRIVLPASGTLLVATSHGLYKSIDGGKHFGNNPRAFDTSLNAFDNSLPVPITTLNGTLPTNAISDLKLDTATPGTVYAAVRGVGIFKSTDAGTTFPASGAILTIAKLPSGTQISGIDFITFAQSTRPDNQTFYVTVAVTAGQKLGQVCNNLTARHMANPPPLAMFKSIDGGATWPTRISLGAEVVISLQEGYDQTIGVDPWDAKRVYIGLRGLFASSDGGATGFRDWQAAQSDQCSDPGHQNNKLDYERAHVDQHAIAFSPHATAAPTRVFTGNDGGIATTDGQISNSGSSTWQLLNHGLSTVLFYGMDIGRGSSTHNAYTYGASQDNGTSVKTPSQSGTNDWVQTVSGDSTDVSVDPANPLHAISNSDGCFASTADALDWSAPSGTSCRNNFPPNTPGLSLVRFDPSGGVAYASAKPQLLRSKNNGGTFALMHSFPQSVTAMNQVKGSPNTIWVGLKDGTVQYTHNAQQGATATWTARTVTGAPTGQAVTGIAIDPVETKTVVVVYPGFSTVTPSKHAFLTTTDGSDYVDRITKQRHPGWSDISGTVADSDLADLPLYAVVIVPTTSPHTIVVGSDAGVMQSADFGQTWQVLGTGFPTVKVKALALDSEVNPPLLRAATFGRSVFELGPPPGPPQCKATPLCSGAITITCTGPDVGIDFSPCSSPNGEPVSCSVGFNGSTTVSVSLYPATPEGKACTVNEGARTCVQLDFPFGGEPSGPPGLPCPVCEAGQTWCDKYYPPRCVSEQDCTVIPTHPNQPTPH